MTTRSRPRRLEGVRVLFVEDNDDTRELFDELLQSFGAEVRSAESAETALATLDMWTPDLVLSDIGLPGDDGYTLMRRIRERSTRGERAIPGVALTAFSSADDRRRALEAGFVEHVGKPVLDIDELADTLADAVQGRRAADDARRAKPPAPRNAHAAR